MIEKIEICQKSRDEFPAFLRAMQHIYMDKDVSEHIFRILEDLICTINLKMNIYSIIWMSSVTNLTAVAVTSYF